VPGHEGIAGNETADLLGRTRSEHLFTGPEPACGISVGVPKRPVRDWMNRNHKKQWESTTGFISGPSARRTKGSAEIKQRPIKMDGRTMYRTLSSKGTHFQTGIDG
jgi:hypothetical protein